MSRSGRWALAACLAIAPGACSLAPGQEPPRRPNVLLLVADDLGKRIGCYGDPVAKTPHLDRLAARGMRFDRAYCQAPLCNPSRVSFMSGLRPPTTGVYDNTDDWRRNPAIERTLADHFRANGYETISAGKMFHASKSDDSRWSSIATPVVSHERSPTTLRKLELDVHPRGKLPISWGEAGKNDLDHIDGGVAEAAARILGERPPEAPPFVLAVGFTKPHSPFTAPAPYFERFADARMPLPEFPADDLADLPDAALQGAALTRGLSEQSLTEILRAYYASVAYLDACVGRVLEALEGSPHAENTIVVFTADHGLLLGEHGLLLKDLLFEEATACPLIVHVPSLGTGGRSCSGLVELVDLLPTLSELCGVPQPEKLEGTSLVPLLREPERPWKRAVFTNTKSASSVRTERWRFTVHGSSGLELYDLERDPHEFTNLAGEAESAEILAEMRALLEGGWRAALPGG